MTSSISLASFILKGVLGSIGLGSSLDDVRQLFGEPEDFGWGLSRIKIEKYFGGSLEISYKNNVVILIAVYLKRGFLNEGTIFQLNCDFSTGVDGDGREFLNGIAQREEECQAIDIDEQSSSWKLANGAVITLVGNSIESIQVAA